MAASSETIDAPPLLEVDDLVVRFRGGGRVVRAVNSVSFTVGVGETVGIVGESGSGKTVTMMSILRLLPSPPAEVTGGTAKLLGEDLFVASETRLRELRGQSVAIVFQDPMTSLNPVIKIGEQIREAIWVHDRDGSRRDHLNRVTELLELVGVPDASRRSGQYPHEFSGGMRQRAMIAMAIANRPALLIADEPTTALDVTIQAQVIDVLMEAKRELGAATVLITHDLGVVADITDRVLVMYAGRIVEQGSTAGMFARPRHPYTIGLIASLPSIDVRRTRLYSIPGQPPNLAHLPTGCAFRTRCAVGRDRPRCRDELPVLVPTESAHSVACHFLDEVAEWAATDAFRPEAAPTGSDA